MRVFKVQELRATVIEQRAQVIHRLEVLTLPRMQAAEVAAVIKAEHSLIGAKRPDIFQGKALTVEAQGLLRDLQPVAPARKNMRIGYARISTEEQSLALQRDALEAAHCDRVFEDIGVSGASRSRPGLDSALTALQPGDTFVIWRFDRLGRSLAHLVEIMAGLETRRCAFLSLTEAIDTGTPAGRLHFHLAAAFAQFERDLISDRTKAGLVAARKRGVRIGRPRKLSAGQVRRIGERVRKGRCSITFAAATRGIHPSTLSRALKRQAAIGSGLD